ncbi:hypothetical protein OIV83_001178 [Microbotryomycetes sp. JL201]|nr:hypothetical protein OIV83_001178 [Microbotryomycetes sp. JL201]
MLGYSAVALALVASSAIAAPSSSSAEQRCSQLAKLAKARWKNNISIITNQLYPDGTTLTEPTAIPEYSAPVPDLPAFCRFAANVTTSSASKFKFELFLPVSWGGRFIMVGNGGMNGGVAYPDMWAPITKYHAAVASTNTGHDGSSIDGSWLINSSPGTQVDFGYRAVHMTTEYSKQLIKDFYKSSAKHSYWMGCSSGGKQGLRELQQYPDTFDGVISGAAAQWWSHLNAWTYRVNAVVDAPGSPGNLGAKDYAVIGPEVRKQCDELDGLKDGIITNPRKCKPNLKTITCTTPGVNQSACITPAQVQTMQNVWANWTASNGDFLYWGFEKGAEGNPFFSVTGNPFPPAPAYFLYQVLNKTQPSTLNANETEIQRLLKIADATDPGQTNAYKADISPFFKKGGKLITYVGLGDALIPSGQTLGYYEAVRKVVPQTLFDQSYKMYAVPGMSHCAGGYAAWNFGGPGQRPDSQSGSSRPAVFDDKHDMALAMFKWVEKGTKPDFLIGSKYVNDDKRQGVQFQRPLCAYPQEPKYIGGDANKASSFKCV